ncbi:hypothetical protein M2272_001566 [Mycobacterium frederiksbergense]|uniref:Uncharacterized protein n=1 Tax=Mycolicibacterium frederiksbergense TaxID=117567 RepID=A0ABT6KW55_9MYCO|nr:hypothetical protein [Mycolicibacterium frederiksbergense]
MTPGGLARKQHLLDLERAGATPASVDMSM